MIDLLWHILSLLPILPFMHRLHPPLPTPLHRSAKRDQYSFFCKLGYSVFCACGLPTLKTGWGGYTTNVQTSYTIASDSFEYMDPPFQTGILCRSQRKCSIRKTIYIYKASWSHEDWSSIRSETPRAQLNAKWQIDTWEWKPQTHTDADINTQTHIWRLTKQKPDGLTHTWRQMALAAYRETVCWVILCHIETNISWSKASHQLPVDGVYCVCNFPGISKWVSA